MVGMRVERKAVAHRLGAIAYSRCSIRKPRMRVNRRFAILSDDFQFVMKEHGIFAEGRLCRMVNICKQTAV